MAAATPLDATIARMGIPFGQRQQRLVDVIKLALGDGGGGRVHDVAFVGRWDKVTPSALVAACLMATQPRANVVYVGLTGRQCATWLAKTKEFLDVFVADGTLTEVAYRAREMGTYRQAQTGDMTSVVVFNASRGRGLDNLRGMGITLMIVDEYRFFDPELFVLYPFLVNGTAIVTTHCAEQRVLQGKDEVAE